jgi:hypothetical protein
LNFYKNQQDFRIIYFHFKGPSIWLL